MDLLFSIFFSPSPQSVKHELIGPLVYSKTSLFFTCLLSRYDSYNVLLLFKTAIDQRVFNYGEERRVSSALLVSLDIFRVSWTSELEKWNWQVENPRNAR